MATKKAPAKKEELPELDWMTDGGAGFEGVSQDDLGFPFLTIMQKGSPEVDEDHDKYVEGLAKGDIVLSTNKKAYADKASGLSIVPVGYQKAYVEWTPRDAGGGYVGVHDRSILQLTTKNDKGQDVLENGNLIVTTGYFFGFVWDEDDSDWLKVVISMTSTQLKKARQWLNMMSSHKGTGKDGSKFLLPMFAFKYTITTVPESNDLGSWYGWKIEQGGMVTDVVLANSCRAEHKEIAMGAMSALAAPTASEEGPF